MTLYGRYSLCCFTGTSLALAISGAMTMDSHASSPTIVPVADQGAASISATDPAEDTAKLYTVKDGRVDPKTYEGWIRFSGFCQRCHGTGGIGSAVAPSLVDAVKRLSSTEFAGIVLAGRNGTWGVMPTWGGNPNIVPYIDNIYAYLKARADGALGPGRPEKLDAPH